jgi:hypothetical protein
MRIEKTSMLNGLNIGMRDTFIVLWVGQYKET